MAHTYAENRVHIQTTPGRYAVLLNARARGWTGQTHHDVQRYVRADDLFLTDDFRQAERTVDKLVDAGYDAIFTGGGDGTICYLMDAIRQRIDAGRIGAEQAPPVGVLRMGTGNAIATFVGASSVAQDLRALRSGAPLVVHDVDMLGDPDGLFPFAGVGLDAEVLNDYAWLRDTTKDTLAGEWATGFGGYWASMLSRTIPRTIRQDPVRVAVTAVGDTALGLDAHGRVAATYSPGDVLFEGPVNQCAAATIPYWGFKARIFPYAATRRGLAHLRCFNGSIPWMLSHLPRFWKGDFRPQDIDDFLVDAVRLDVRGRPMPYQVAGDGVGHRRSLEWQVTDRPVQLAVPMH